MVLARPNPGRGNVACCFGLDTADGVIRLQSLSWDGRSWSHPPRWRTRLMAQDPFGNRDGEIAGELPESLDASLYFMGRIRTPSTQREDVQRSATACRALLPIRD